MMTPRSIESVATDSPSADVFLQYAFQLDRDHPGYLASIGVTAEQYARDMAAPGLTIEESVEAGWMSPAEARFLTGEATLEDLIELGHSPDEACAMLQDQR